ncbi:3'-5' exonuclease [Candidatus Legionella polyplacis]|uniref:3'-5' exonuclease n=1 Tax=Candidatus Legionella polyplacis TaxID=2005262 RepID=UPI000C1EA251|nr:3'-5' exonuclease [Candidatus Legionella polyplacis]ATW01927.1 3'-5' exonuclease [Candidatus Legionella polyplacis]
MNIMVFDIETIPDIELGKKIYSLNSLSNEDVFLALCALRKDSVGHSFFPHFLQKIIVISVLFKYDNYIKVWSLGSIQSGEKELLKRFFFGIEKYVPILVSWNGCRFDLPVIHYRSLLHKVSSRVYWETGSCKKEFRWNNYLNRFHYRHIDLMDILSAYQSTAFASLDIISSMLGFPGKINMSGERVWDVFNSGNIEDIRNYCEIDVLNTYCIYLRFELIRGFLTENKYEYFMKNLLSYLRKEKNKEHLKDFLDLINF